MTRQSPELLRCPGCSMLVDHFACPQSVALPLSRAFVSLAQPLCAFICCAFEPNWNGERDRRDGNSCTLHLQNTETTRSMVHYDGATGWSRLDTTEKAHGSPPVVRSPQQQEMSAAVPWPSPKELLDLKSSLDAKEAELCALDAKLRKQGGAVGEVRPAGCTVAQWSHRMTGACSCTLLLCPARCLPLSCR